MDGDSGGDVEGMRRWVFPFAGCGNERPRRNEASPLQASARVPALRIVEIWGAGTSQDVLPLCLHNARISMGLFSNTSSTEHESSPMANAQSPTQDQINLVGKGTVFEGTVRAEDDVRASGQIVGTLQVDGKAMIAESGAVDGEIIATNAEIAGRVQGEIEVEERLVLKNTAQVDGNIETDRLVVEEGAQFTGECKMSTPVAVEGTASGRATSPDGAPSNDEVEEEEPASAEESS